MNQKTRVRFAPSPTGGLHLGGVRTVLYNYLFARKMGGDFVLRIEDTDQSRFVRGAEEYIFNCLSWLGLEPDESTKKPGPYGPYRQSERKDLYRPYAEKLVSEGHAYYAFDTPGDLEKMRQDFKTEHTPTPQYDHTIRPQMKNSLSIPEEETKALLAAGTPHVIRIKMPPDETISFIDMIRGEVSFETGLVDDKVLLKADGMPTYHLAVVVDDHLMKITHAFRGEEWLPSAPVHILLWKYLFGLEEMPAWAHFPLILGPSGKLSKRDGAKYGFPVFAMTWLDPKSGETTEGFKEKGFLPGAFLNLLALLGWNDGTEKEIFTIEELIERFSMDRVHNAGAKFDYEKAKWFNHEWIKHADTKDLLPYVKDILHISGITTDNDELLEKVVTLVKERCHLLPDFAQQASFFFTRPESWDLDAVRPKWNEAKKEFFTVFAERLKGQTPFDVVTLETVFKELAIEKNIKPGELQLPLRIMLVGGKFGPPVFAIAEVLEKEETIRRITAALGVF
ncbi:MAG TPA: glutamate--tRNA ligase [Chitinophagaceae bacterium]|nr:glutamate--tRNA ligase [Chitinophagaceae bacterium]